MTREQNQLIKKIRNLSPDDVARVLQFLQQPKSPELRVVQTEVKAVASDATEEQAAQPAEGVAAPGAAPATPQPRPVFEPATSAVAQNPVRQEPVAEAISPEAEVARAACAQWRRRPFQAIDADDLGPIAALFREAVDTRAQSRFRYGSR
jgi:hypothetical protein